MEAVRTGSRDMKLNTVISIPSAFGVGEMFPSAYTATVVKLVILGDCKIVRKDDAMHELFSLKLIEAKDKGDPQMKAIEDMVQAKDADLERKFRAIGAYLGQQMNDFHVRENCLWMDEGLNIPIPLRKAVVNRIHKIVR